MAAVYDLYLDQGATWRENFIYRYISGGTEEAPVYTGHNITGCIVRMQIRKKVGDPVLVEVTSLGDDVEITDPIEGEFTIEISDEESMALNLRRATYDLELEYPSGDVVRLMQGRVYISLNVTV